MNNQLIPYSGMQSSFNNNEIDIEESAERKYFVSFQKVTGTCRFHFPNPQMK